MKILIPWNEIEVTSTRSSGAGGQHINRTNSAVILRFSVMDSLVLTIDQKNLILQKLKNRLTKSAELLVRQEDERDQKSNKERAYLLLNEMIIAALRQPKKRVATKPKKSAVKRRLETKKRHSEIKKNRSEKIRY